MWTVYMHVNKVNGKKYVGITSRSIATRWRNGEGYRCQFFYKAITKYGWDEFEHKIIAVNLSEKEAKQMEMDLILKHNTTSNKFGYNMTFGGEGNKPTEQIMLKFLGKNNHFYGKKHNEETKKMLRVKCIKRGEENGNYGNRSGNNPLSKKIAQIDIKTLEVVKVWDASIDITRELKIHSGNICKLCILISNENVWKKYKGYYWCYAQDISKIHSKKDTVNAQYRKVIQRDLTTNEIVNVFENISQAAKFVGVGAENISRCCKGKNKSCGGYFWQYESEEYKYKNKITGGAIGSKNHMSKKVVQLTLNGKFIALFETIKDAALVTKTSAAGIYTFLSNKNRRQSGGYRWQYLTEYNQQLALAE